ncbi:M48 family metallopeptidase [Orrella marina]|uniref:M48 family peptidase n=1 Tax=Orrella marina TaxID=2163011 RepID=A0A2R4XN86_9BURK|nr:SprT family zinc-dependent metalloprotease [Orrella marina]AWB35272.1 M48 family peptidase [Orrella marina]
MSRQLSLDFDSLELTPSGATRNSQIGIDLRTVHLQGVALQYQLVRSRRRSIGLTVGENGLRVAAPSWVGMAQIESAIVTKFDWIVGKLSETAIRKEKMATAERNWQFGGRIPYMGLAIELCDGSRHSSGRRDQYWFEGDPLMPAEADRLWLRLPAQAQPQQIREMAQGWLQAQARHWFGLRLAAFEAQCGLKPTSWRLSNASGRWGSCNSQGRIGLNWRLIHFEKPVIDYVIAHELAHLKELNHSAAFWQTLKAIYPDYIRGHTLLKAHVPGQLPEL